MSYALDRRALAPALSDLPADQIVPPAVPGFPAGRVYPLDRPDLGTARRLLAGQRPHAVIGICGDTRLPKLAAIVRLDLARIGMSASVLQAPQCPGRFEHADLSFVTLGSNQLDPGVFVGLALTTGVFGAPLGPGPWNSRAFRMQLERARALRGQARTVAFREIEDKLMRMAPLAVYGSWVWAEYLSPKVGCKVFQAEYGFVDLGALCKNS